MYYRAVFGDTLCEITVLPEPTAKGLFVTWALRVREDGRLFPVIHNGRPVRGEFLTVDDALRNMGDILATCFGDRRGSFTRLS